MTNRTEQEKSWYQRVESLYQRALDIPEERRRSFLSDEADGEAELLQEVELLLEHFEVARYSFLNTPAHGLAAHGTEEEPLPDRIGPYKVLGILGSGGMGVVYRAEQEHPQREVALKVIRAGIAGRNLLRRFEFETTVLGRLKHPGIAQIYEAGTYDSETGKRPFFAMELVEGPPLHRYVAEYALNTRARLDLFLKVCDAVNHAHQKGVIHRDLKPSNILVSGTSDSGTAGNSTSGKSTPGKSTSVKSTSCKSTSGDSTSGNSTSDNSASDSDSRADGGKASPPYQGGVGGVPNILDFGVARATDSDLQTTTLQTDVHQIVGTLSYMSPEQVEGKGHLLDVRSDVYALGVVLYELLAGHVPFTLDGKTVAAAARVICDDEPPPLATIDVAYRGDLNTIAFKALEKDPERRYQSVADLAADVRRYLHDEPITARPATTIYQLRKFVRRNRGLVAGVSAAFIVLVLGLIVSVSFAIERSRALQEAQRQENVAVTLAEERSRALDEANRQRDIAQAVNEFVDRDILASANPSNEPNRAISLREVVDRAAGKVGERFANQPMVEAAIRTTLANTYKGLGEYAEAALHARTALERLESVSQEPTRELLLTINRVASLEKAQGHWTEAEALYRRGLKLADSTFGPEHEATMSITNNLALLLERQFEYEEAADLLEQLLERRIRLLGEEHEHTMITMNNLALVYLSMERFDEAERLHERELELSKRVMGPEHPGTLISIGNLATVYSRRKQFDKAEPLMRNVLEVQTRVLGANHPSTLETMSALASILAGQERHDEAESLLLESSAASSESLGPEHPQMLRTRRRLATLYLKTGQLDRAASIARQTVEIEKRVLGEYHGATGVTLGLLAEILLGQGDLKQAETTALESYEILKAAIGPKQSETRQSAKVLSGVYDHLGQPQDADHWRALAGE